MTERPNPEGQSTRFKRQSLTEKKEGGLILDRKIDEGYYLLDTNGMQIADIHILRIGRDRVTIRTKAISNVRILRKELLERDQDDQEKKSKSKSL